MKRMNFSIEKNSSITVDGSSLDLHNDYDFLELNYEPRVSKVSLLWKKVEGDWVKETLSQKLRIVFNQVSIFKTQVNVDSNEQVDRLTLSFVGYLHPEDIDTMDGCLDELESNDSYHIIFGFENGLAIKLYSEEVKCLLSS